MVIRKITADDFALVHVNALDDYKLGASTIGALAYLSAIPVDQDVTPDILVKRFRFSERRAMAIIQLLTKRGYLEVVKGEEK